MEDTPSQFAPSVRETRSPEHASHRGRQADECQPEACACIENARTARGDAGEFEQVRLMPNVGGEVLGSASPPQYA